jgi:hypothetical protein
VHSEVWDEETARTYDEDEAEMSSPAAVQPIVEVLAGLAAGGRALEFAVGTGRIAIPLAARGVDVVGIELSQPMIDRLRSKPGGARVRAIRGDMSRVRADGSFSLVYLVYNTITNLLTQESQVACFENAAAHLEPGGCFVVETFVPSLRRLPVGDRFVPFDVSDDHIGIDEYDVANQMLVSHHVVSRSDGVRRTRSRFRYAWPAEYDLMARIAGMHLSDRWGDWLRAPFTASSTSHVSVWRRPTATAARGS